MMLEKVRIGFVGTGGIAAHHMGNLKKLEAVQFAAMCDVVEERAAEPAEEHDCPAFTDYRRMLDEVEMDALYVCVPPFAHEDAELRAAERGIPLRRKTSGHGGAEGCRGYPALSRMYYVERWGSVQMKDRQLSPGRAEVSESGE